MYQQNEFRTTLVDQRHRHARPTAPSSTPDDQIRVIEPAVLYFGTPVVLTSTLNEDGSLNLAPISCVWWLGWSCVLGYDTSSKTTKNLEREKECVLNLPSAQLVGSVDPTGLSNGQQSDAGPQKEDGVSVRAQ